MRIFYDSPMQRVSTSALRRGRRGPEARPWVTSRLYISASSACSRVTSDAAARRGVIDIFSDPGCTQAVDSSLCLYMAPYDRVGEDTTATLARGGR
jgi:hypothetical protein